jgi:hypothetical protein
MKGHIRQRSKRTYEITLDIGTDPKTGKRRRNSETVHGTKKDAERRLVELLAQLQGGTYVRPKMLKVAEYLLQWLGTHVAGCLSGKKAESYRQELLDYVIPRLGHPTR